MKKISKSNAEKLAKKYKLNLDIIPFDEWKFGLEVELEHGKKISKITNITHDNLDMTAKIAIAHLIEDPRYYKYLKQMELKRETYWEKRKKPTIFLD
jgi:hypothetical protein